MKHKTVFILLLAVFILTPLLLMVLSNQTYGVSGTATAKCLYSGAGGDCGSCTCSGIGHNGQCSTNSFYPAGCNNGHGLEKCHECNIPRAD